MDNSAPYHDYIRQELRELAEIYALPLFSRRCKLVWRFPAESNPRLQQLIVLRDLQTNALRLLLAMDSWVSHLAKFENGLVLNVVNPFLVSFIKPLTLRRLEAQLEAASLTSEHLQKVLREAVQHYTHPSASIATPLKIHPSSATPQESQQGHSGQGSSLPPTSPVNKSQSDASTLSQPPESRTEQRCSDPSPDGALSGLLDDSVLQALNEVFDATTTPGNTVTERVTANGNNTETSNTPSASSAPDVWADFDFPDLKQVDFTSILDSRPPWEKCGLSPDIFQELHGDFTREPELWVVFDELGLLVILPDVLTRCTTVDGSRPCPRRQILRETLTSYFYTTTAARKALARSTAARIGGQMAHMVMQDALRSNLATEGSALQVLARSATISRWKELVSGPTDTIAHAQKTVNETLAFYQHWASRHVSEVQLPPSPSVDLVAATSTSSTEGTDFDESLFEDPSLYSALLDMVPATESAVREVWPRDIPLSISHVLDIEEDFRSLVFGLKGRIDVTAIIALHALQNKEPTQLTSLPRPRSMIVFPLELKSGASFRSYRDQVILYTMLLFERYRLPPNGLSCDAPAFPVSSRGATVAEPPADKPFGALLNPRTSKFEKISAQRVDILNLVQLRNEVAYSIYYLDLLPEERRQRISGAAVSAKASSDSSSQNCQPSASNTTEHSVASELLTTQGYPHVLRNPQICGRCFDMLRCMLVHVALENGTLETFGGLPVLEATPEIRQIKDSQEMIAAACNKLWNQRVGFLTDEDRQFASKWIDLLDEEYCGIVRSRADGCGLSYAEKALRGLSLDGLLLVDATPLEPSHVLLDSQDDSLSQSHLDLVKSRVKSKYFDYEFAIDPLYNDYSLAASGSHPKTNSTLDIEDLHIISSLKTDEESSSLILLSGISVGDLVHISVFPSEALEYVHNTPLWKILQEDEDKVLKTRELRFLAADRGHKTVSEHPIRRSFYSRAWGKVISKTKTSIIVRVAESAGMYGPLAEYVPEIPVAKVFLDAYSPNSPLKENADASEEADAPKILSRSIQVSRSSSAGTDLSKKPRRPLWCFALEKEEEPQRTVKLLKENILYLFEPDVDNPVPEVTLNQARIASQRQLLRQLDAAMPENELESFVSNLCNVYPEDFDTCAPFHLAIESPFEFPSRLRRLIVRKAPPRFSTWCRANKIDEIQGINYRLEFPDLFGTPTEDGQKRVRRSESNATKAHDPDGLSLLALDMQHSTTTDLQVRSRARSRAITHDEDDSGQALTTTSSLALGGKRKQPLGLDEAESRGVGLLDKMTSLEDMQRIMKTLSRLGPSLFAPDPIPQSQSYLNSGDEYDLDDGDSDNEGETFLSSQDVYQAEIELYKNLAATPTPATHIDTVEESSRSDFPIEDLPLLNTIAIELNLPAHEYSLVIANNFRGLNPEQQAVIVHALNAKDYALCLGYPGTGKTSTITVLIQILIAKGYRVLLSSHTHASVDNVMLKLMRYPSLNGKLLRIGELNRIHRGVWPCTLELDGELNPSLLQSSSAMKMNLFRRFRTRDEYSVVLDSKLLVGSTSLGITNDLMSGQSFDFVIVDEAAQMTLPATLGPLRLLRPGGRFVLVGDVNQLRPLVRSPIAGTRGLEVSLFEYLSRLDDERVRKYNEAKANAKDPSILDEDLVRYTSCQVALVSQYRMNAEILSLANTLVYEGQLRCASSEVAQSRMKTPDHKVIRQLAADVAVKLSPGAEDYVNLRLESVTPKGHISSPPRISLTKNEEEAHGEADTNEPAVQDSEELRLHVIEALITEGLTPDEMPPVQSQGSPINSQRTRPVAQSSSPRTTAKSPPVSLSKTSDMTRTSHSQKPLETPHASHSTTASLHHVASSPTKSRIRLQVTPGSIRSPFLIHRHADPHLANVHSVGCALASWLGWAIDPSRPVVMIDSALVPRPRSQEISDAAVTDAENHHGTKVFTMNTSMYNPFEAIITMWVVVALLAAGLNPQDIGIISPYRAQLDCLRALIEQEKDKIITFVQKARLLCSLAHQTSSRVFRSKAQLGSDMSSLGHGGSLTNGQQALHLPLDDLELHTVDRFQGRDKACIILTMVRNNSAGVSGSLLQDRRRINVALTRAQHKLVLIGHSLTLAGISSDDGVALDPTTLKAKLESSLKRSDPLQGENSIPSASSASSDSAPPSAPESVMRECVRSLKRDNKIVTLPPTTLEGFDMKKFQKNVILEPASTVQPFLDWVDECLGTVPSTL